MNSTDDSGYTMNSTDDSAYTMNYSAYTLSAWTLPPSRRTQLLPYIYTSLVLLATGFFTNCINMLVLRRFKSSPSLVYMQAISAADLLGSLSMLPALIYQFQRWTLYYWFILAYYLGRCVNFIFVGFVILLTLAVTIERFLVTTFPTRAKRLSSITKARIGVITSLVIAIIGRMPGPLAIWNIREEIVGDHVIYSHSLSDFFFTQLGTYLRSASTIFFEYIAIICIVIFNVGICWNLVRRRRARKDLVNSMGNVNVIDERENRLIVSLIVVSFVTVLSMTPGEMLRIVPLDPAVAKYLFPVLNSLYFAKHSLNFFVYLATLKEFRNHLKAIGVYSCYRYR